MGMGMTARQPEQQPAGPLPPSACMLKAPLTRVTLLARSSPRMGGSGGGSGAAEEAMAGDRVAGSGAGEAKAQPGGALGGQLMGMAGQYFQGQGEAAPAGSATAQPGGGLGGQLMGMAGQYLQGQGQGQGQGKGKAAPAQEPGVGAKPAEVRQALALPSVFC
jgi:hypothetical protein